MHTQPHALLFAIEHACEMVITDNRDLARGHSRGRRILVDHILAEWNTGTSPTLAQAREAAFLSSWNADLNFPMPSLSPEQVAIAGKILGLYCDLADHEHDTGEDCSRTVDATFGDPATACKMLGVEYPGRSRPESEDRETSDEGEGTDIDSLDNRHLYRDDRDPDSAEQDYERRREGYARDSFCW